jgi:hypothetical protein
MQNMHRPPTQVGTARDGRGDRRRRTSDCLMTIDETQSHRKKRHCLLTVECLVAQETATTDLTLYWDGNLNKSLFRLLRSRCDSEPFIRGDALGEKAPAFPRRWKMVPLQTHSLCQQAARSDPSHSSGVSRAMRFSPATHAPGAGRGDDKSEAENQPATDFQTHRAS